MKQLVRSISVSFVLIASVIPIVATSTALALSGPGQAVCNGASLTGAGGDCSATNGSTNINNVLAFVINLLSSIVGVVAVVMIIIAGFKFITAGGDASQVASAKSTVIYAVIGLAITALSQVLVHFVLNNVKISG